MIRCTLALFLITALILNQAAFAFAHVHKGEGDSAPHIHLPWESHAAHGHSHSTQPTQSHRHAHDHSHSHHHQHGESHHHDHDVPAENENDWADYDSHSDAQNEAVIFVHHDAFIASSGHRMIAAFCVSMLASDSTTEVSIPIEHQFSKSFSDAPARTSCAIYLQTRSLRL